MTIYAACGQLKLPILFHLDESQHRPPGLPGLERAFGEHPETQFIGHGPGWWASISGRVTQADLALSRRRGRARRRDRRLWTSTPTCLAICRQRRASDLSRSRLWPRVHDSPCRSVAVRHRLSLAGARSAAIRAGAAIAIARRRASEDISRQCAAIVAIEFRVARRDCLPTTRVTSRAQADSVLCD